MHFKKFSFRSTMEKAITVYPQIFEFENLYSGNASQMVYSNSRLFFRCGHNRSRFLEISQNATTF